MVLHRRRVPLVIASVLAMSLYFAGPVSAATNHLDSDTATLEGSIGQWIPWFSTTVAQSTEQAHTGTHSLRVDITNPWGWGVHFANWPGFPATAGTTEIGFSALLGQGSLGATMYADWFDADHNRLRLDSVDIPSLTSTWQSASAQVSAPAGTAFVEVQVINSPGLAGDFLYLDDITVSSITNAIDLDTSTIEGSTGHWIPWFNTSIAQSAAQAHGGSHSLEVAITAPFWGVQLDNSPGFAATPGNKTIAFWGMLGTGSPFPATMTVTWYDAGQSLLQTDSVSIASLSGTWQQASTNVTAPAGTASVLVTFSNGLGGPGDSVFLDDITVLDA